MLREKSYRNPNTVILNRYWEIERNVMYQCNQRDNRINR